MTLLDDFLLEQHQYRESTKEHYKDAFLLLSRFTDHPFSLNRQEMNLCLDKMKARLSEYGFNGYVHDIRRFYKWLNGGEEYPECVKHIKLKKIRRLDYLVKKILSQGEVKALLRGCDNPRNRAIIAVLIATGCRRGELLNLHLRDVHAEPYGFRLTLTGKTGTFLSPPVDREFAKILSVWLEHHPNRDNPDSALWVRRKGNKFEPIRTTMLNNVLKQAARDIGLQRNIHAHMFRHSENTWSTIAGVSRATRNKTHGWSSDGNTAAIYESLTDKDAEKEYRRAHGGHEEEVTLKDGFATVKCGYCDEDNPCSAKFCHFCHVPLDPKEAERFLKERRVLDLLLNNEDLVKDLEELAKKRNQKP